MSEPPTKEKAASPEKQCGRVGRRNQLTTSGAMSTTFLNVCGLALLIVGTTRSDMTLISLGALISGGSR